MAAPAPQFMHLLVAKILERWPARKTLWADVEITCNQCGDTAIRGNVKHLLQQRIIQLLGLGMIGGPTIHSYTPEVKRTYAGIRHTDSLRRRDWRGQALKGGPQRKPGPNCTPDGTATH